MDSLQRLRAHTFKALHERKSAFIVANPWDAGSAKLLAAMGFEALATSSAGLAFSLGRTDGDGGISRDETLENIRQIIAATALPITADLENGFAHSPEGCAENLRQAIACGIVGGSIEDASGKAEAPIYEFEHAVERVKAAVAVARSMPFPFMLTARAENLLHGRTDFADTLRRLEAYAEAGADVLYAPGLQTRDQIAAVVKAVSPKPVNVLMGLDGVALSVRDLSELGVKRISVGSSLARAAFGGLLRAAEEMRDHGTFTYAEQAMPFARLNGLFKD